jgi:hypothetical protein
MFLIIFSGDNRVVLKLIADRFASEESFFFKDLHHGGNTVIMGCWFGKMGDDFFDECFFEIPEGLHYLFFSFGKFYHD